LLHSCRLLLSRERQVLAEMRPTDRFYIRFLEKAGDDPYKTYTKLSREFIVTIQSASYL